MSLKKHFFYKRTYIDVSDNGDDTAITDYIYVITEILTPDPNVSDYWEVSMISVRPEGIHLTYEKQIFDHGDYEQINAREYHEAFGEASGNFYRQLMRYQSGRV